MDKNGEFRRVNWTEQFNFVRKALGCQSPGYLIHEAIRWSPHMRKWVFMPRRVSKEAYDDEKDEKRGSNKVVIVGVFISDMNKIELTRVQRQLFMKTQYRPWWSLRAARAALNQLQKSMHFALEKGRLAHSTEPCAIMVAVT